MVNRFTVPCGLGESRIPSAAFLWSIATLSLLTAPVSRAAPLVLVEDGRPRSVILLEDNAGDAVRLAARELQQHVQRASGAQLPILAPFEAAPLPDDTVRVVFGPGGLARQHGLREADLPQESFRIKAIQDWERMRDRAEERHGPLFPGPAISERIRASVRDLDGT
jgi:hypothetical protein